MSIITGIAVYVVVWWIVLFTVLPWGAAPPESPQPGTAPSAPLKPRLRLKFLVTSLIAVVVWGAIYLLVNSNLISFRDALPAV